MKSRVREFALFRAGILGLGIFGAGAVLPAQSVATVGELLAGVRGRSTGGGIQSYFVIPVAGHVEGANATEFRADVTFLSGGPSPQRVAVAWLAQGTDSSAQPLDFFEVGPGPAFFPDMVATTLGKSGLGALVVAAVTPEGAFDRTAHLSGFARVWTRVPGCSGTSSLAIESSHFLAGAGSALGLLLDARHRGTIGLVNPNAEARTWTMYAGGGRFEISVPPASMTQVPIPHLDAGPIAVTAILNGADWFVGYATSIDQLSGDGWLVTMTNLGG